MVVIIQNIQEKANLQETKVNNTKTRKVCVDISKVSPAKEWIPYTSSSFGSRVLSCLNGFMVLKAP